MKVKVWGARGSLPTPLKPAEVRDKIRRSILGLPDIDTKDPAAVDAYLNSLPALLSGTAGGNTTCIEIQAGNETFIIDAGSGLRELGLELMKGLCGRGEGVLHLFFTHAHWDHIMGFPFFVPAFIPGNKLFIYSIHNLNNALERQQQPISFPVPLSYMQSTIEFITIEPGRPFSVGTVEINTIATAHPGIAYAFRFTDRYNSFVFASDAEYKQLDETSLAPYIDFYRDAELLFFDAQYTLREAWQKIDWGHSSALIGTEIARRAGVKKLILVHHDPTYSDAELLKIQQDAINFQEQDTLHPPCEVIVAYEGLTFDLTPPGTIDIHPVSEDEDAILTARGSIDERGIFELEKQLSTLAETGASYGLVIDLSQTETLTTAGLQALVSLRKERSDTPIVLAAPSPNVSQVIKLAGFTDYFAVYPTVEAAQTALQAVAALNLPGHLLGDRYQIEGKIADTQQGGVYRAIDAKNKQPVAVKVISASFGASAVNQFRAQAQQITNFDHPHILKVFDCDQDRSLSYIIEEFTELRSLGEVLAENAHSPLPTDQAREISLSIVSALEYAHNRGVIHSNLSAHNILLADNPKLKNFGRGRLEEGRKLLNRPLMLLEAPYLSPEQIEGRPSDARSDLYALGVVLYEMFVGKPPFTGDEQSIMQAHLKQTPPAPRNLNPQLSRSLEYLILKLLAKEPDERYATAHQVQQILSNLTVSDEDDSGLAAYRYPDSSPLIGREDELAQMQAVWAQVQQADSPKLLLVRGELGIGKSRLVAEFLIKDIVDRRANAFVGHCDEFGLPYGPFAEVLTAIFDKGLVNPQSISDQIPYLISQIPALASILSPHQNTDLTFSPAKIQRAQWHFFDSVLKVLAEVSPAALYLEEAEFVDEASVALIRFVIRRTHLPLLIIAAGRDDEEVPSWFNLFQTDKCEIIGLPPLQNGDVKTYLTSLMGGEISQEVLSTVQKRSRGNPYFIEEVSRHLIDVGVFVKRNGNHWEYEPGKEVGVLPPALMQVFTQRVEMLAETRQIEDLTGAARESLTVAAVIGPEFDFRTWVAVLGGEAQETPALDALDEALGLRLLRRTGGGRYAFDPIDIVDALASSLPDLQQEALHRQIANIMKKRRDNPALISRHYQEAGLIEVAAQYLEKAGKTAMAADAVNEAIGYFKQAMELAESQSGYEMLGALYRQQGTAEKSVQAFQQGLKLAQQANDIAGQARVLNGLALAFWWMYDQYDKAEKLARNVLALSNIPDNERATAQSHLGMIAWMKGDFADAENWYRQTLETLKTGDDEERIADIYNRLGLTLLLRSKYAEATRVLNLSLGMRRKLDDYWGQAYCMNNLARVAMEQGNFHQARFFLVSAQELFEEIDAQDGLMVVNANLGRMWLRQKDVEKALPLLEQAFHYAQHLSRPGAYNLGDIYTLIAEARLQMDDLDQAATAAETALTRVEAAGNRAVIAAARAVLAQIRATESDDAVANDLFQQAITLFEQVDNPAGLLRCQLNYAQFLKTQGQTEAASKLSAAAKIEAAKLGLVL